MLTDEMPFPLPPLPSALLLHSPCSSLSFFLPSLLPLSFLSISSPSSPLPSSLHSPSVEKFPRRVQLAISTLYPLPQ